MSIRKEKRKHMSESAQISIENVSVTYQKTAKSETFTALQNVSLDIRQGEFISFLGPSGCGKTTLLRLIADLQDPSEGNIYVGGSTPSDYRKDNKYSFVFQQPVLFEWRTVEKNVELPLEVRKFPKKEKQKAAAEMLEMAGLKDYAKYFPSQLSGGMQQRVNIARAFSTNPEILLMDEPFSALDEFTKDRLQEDLLKIWRRTHKTVIFVTHNIEEAVFLSDRVCVFSPNPGKLKQIIDIDIPRPRDASVKETAEFYDYVKEIRRVFKK